MFIQQPDFGMEMMEVQCEYRFSVDSGEEDQENQTSSGEDHIGIDGNRETELSASAGDDLTENNEAPAEQESDGGEEAETEENPDQQSEHPQESGNDEAETGEKNKEPDHGELEEEQTKAEENPNPKEKKQKKDEIEKLIRRLALYPNVLIRPLCEATINGEKAEIQILSKRGDKIRIRRDRKIETVHIDEIESLTVKNELR